MLSSSKGHLTLVQGVMELGQAFRDSLLVFLQARQNVRAAYLLVEQYFVLAVSHTICLELLENEGDVCTRVYMKLMTGYCCVLLQAVHCTCGCYFTGVLAKDLDGVVSVWMCGANKSGELGIGRGEDCLLPVRVSALDDKKVDDLAAGSGHCFCR